MGATATRMTADDYYAVTEVGDRTQLVEGEMIRYERPPLHGLLQVRVVVALGEWAAASNRGLALPSTDVRLDEHNVWGPSALWLAPAHVPDDLDAYLEGLPDLCVEIRSRGIWAHEVGPKLRIYERSGLPELWLVDDASESVLVYRRSTPAAGTFDLALELGRGETLASPQLPGFSLALEELFER